MKTALKTIIVRALDGPGSEDGAIALEYGILVLFVVIAIIAGVEAYGESLDAFLGGLWGQTGL
ncbi:MAG: Flp family type IVb pilin [Coriobacteriia bacterium]|nr:Flp family type IVb pilin [Coriobacteriia bacterium]